MKFETGPVENEIKFLIGHFGSRAAVADRLGVDASYVRKMEKGMAPGKHLYRMIKTNPLVKLMTVKKEMQK